MAKTGLIHFSLALWIPKLFTPLATTSILLLVKSMANLVLVFQLVAELSMKVIGGPRILVMMPLPDMVLFQVIVFGI